MITGRQIREGRELVGMRRHMLAVAARIITTARLARVEASDDEADLTEQQAHAVRRALETAGVEFIPENGGGAGVRLRKGEPRP